MGFVGDKIEDLKHFLAEGYPLPDYNQTFETLRPNSTPKPIGAPFLYRYSLGERKHIRCRLKAPFKLIPSPLPS
jgi:hypothetical protein